MNFLRINLPCLRSSPSNKLWWLGCCRMVLEMCAHFLRSLSNQMILATAHFHSCLADRVGSGVLETRDLQMPMYWFQLLVFCKIRLRTCDNLENDLYQIQCQIPQWIQTNMKSCTTGTIIALAICYSSVQLSLPKGKNVFRVQRHTAGQRSCRYTAHHSDTIGSNTVCLLYSRLWPT